MATNQEALDALIDTLHNGSHVVERVGAAEGLGIIGGQHVRAVLIKAMADASHSEVRAAAAKALGQATLRE